MNLQAATEELRKLQKLTPQFLCCFTHTSCVKHCWAFSEALLMKGEVVRGKLDEWSYSVLPSSCSFSRIIQASKMFFLQNKITEINKLVEERKDKKE